MCGSHALSVLPPCVVLPRSACGCVANATPECIWLCGESQKGTAGHSSSRLDVLYVVCPCTGRTGRLMCLLIAWTHDLGHNLGCVHTVVVVAALGDPGLGGLGFNSPAGFQNPGFELIVCPPAAVFARRVPWPWPGTPSLPACCCVCVRMIAGWSLCLPLSQIWGEGALSTAPAPFLPLSMLYILHWVIAPMKSNPRVLERAA